MKIPTFLERLKITKLSLVPRPANQESHVVLFKGDDGIDIPVEETGIVGRLKKFFEEFGGVDKAAQTFDTSLAMDSLYRVTDALSTSVRSILTDDDLTPDDRVAALNESIDQFRQLITGMAALTASDPVGGDDSNTSKGAPPMNVAKSAEVLDLEAKLAKADTDKAELTAQLAKAQADTKDQERLTLAKSIVGDSGMDVSVVDTLLKTADEAGVTALRALCNKASAITKAGTILTEIGKGGDQSGTADTALSEIDKAAAELMKADKALTKPQAVAKALHDDPELYTRSLEA